MKMMKPATLLLNLSIFFILTLTATSQSRINFKCHSNFTCKSLIDYVSPNSTTLVQIQNLFGVKNLRSLLGANSLPLNTSSTRPVSAKEKIKIPFPCMCIGGAGISNRKPVYKVQKDDGLDNIARYIFAALVTYQQIADVNNITNVNKIEVGQDFWIPLPCSCNPVNGSSVVHYGYVLEPGNTVELIAEKYGTTEETLLILNQLSDPSSKLLAGAVLDVPLRACSSEIANTSLDYPLLVPNGTYTFTANNCVKCKCESSNNWKLHCEPSRDQVKVHSWSQCPSMQCQGSKILSLGDIEDSPDPLCDRNVCSYAGYTNQTISTAIVNEGNCRVGGGGVTDPSNNVSKINGSQGSRCLWLVISLSLSSLLSGLVM